MSGQWKRNIFLAAGFYGAEAGGNIESAAAADSHTTAHLSTYCSWQHSFFEATEKSPALTPVSDNFRLSFCFGPNIWGVA